MQALATVFMMLAAATPYYPLSYVGQCHFVDGTALGCTEGAKQEAPANAVTMFENYGWYRTRLGGADVRAFARRYDCVVIRDERYIRGLEIRVLGRYSAYHADELFPVNRILITAPNQRGIYWIDPRYLAGACPTLSPAKGGDAVPGAPRTD
jgi:hypothetical protein